MPRIRLDCLSWPFAPANPSIGRTVLYRTYTVKQPPPSPVANLYGPYRQSPQPQRQYCPLLKRLLRRPTVPTRWKPISFLMPRDRFPIRYLRNVEQLVSG